VGQREECNMWCATSELQVSGVITLILQQVYRYEKPVTACAVRGARANTRRTELQAVSRSFAHACLHGLSGSSVDVTCTCLACMCLACSIAVGLYMLQQGPWWGAGEMAVSARVLL